jgi:hypothetical protein
MGMIGIFLIITAVSYGATPAGFALGTTGAVLTALGLRFGFCPACTVACLLTERPKVAERTE